MSSIGVSKPSSKHFSFGKPFRTAVQKLIQNYLKPDKKYLSI